MDFTLTEAQQDLAGLTRSIVTDLVTNDRLRELDVAEDRLDRELWSTLGSSGVLGAALPESVGGDGFGVLEQCSILVELGRAVAPVPYLSSIVMAADALARYGNEQQRAEWAVPAAAGAKILTVALDEELNDDPGAPVTHAEPAPGGWTLDGTKIVVDAAPSAELFLVPATTPDGVAVFLVRPDDEGVTVTRQQTVDFASTGEVALHGVVLGSDRLLGTVEQGSEIVDRLVERGSLGACAYQYGVLDQALTLTAAYARERVQFGRPIGSFQAVAQRLADAYIDVKGVRLTLWQAAWRLSEGLPGEGDVQTAKFWASDAGHRVAHTAVHIHGGVGLDQDHPVHRYFLAAKALEFRLGSATRQLRTLGAELATVPA
ncbi:acyl-CoA dehydrogenase family protein [Rhodococcus oxybenzonivorans]|uniref:acyl-CoA dehydrogenase family protein n=1 Tax=Rhodococcus TaxID=1827 RepID=UPI001320530E|nr:MULTISPECIES: acyl-CoA dehydrogenase family protein [Rhodococcus]MDV7354216.1 acyl-CoA dehydrogenase family protein [Rhodococcus oxybenzonivorans]QHE67526.1 Butyryl-CoA dehydrogenase [Rhodococcus sp. WAY2]